MTAAGESVRGPGIPGRGLLVGAVGVAIGAIALWLVSRDLDLARTATIAAAANGLFLLAALAVLAVQAVVRAVRWRLLLPARDDGSRIGVPRVLPVMLVGYLGNSVMPARLGEVIRGTLLARREGVSSAESMGSVVLERMIDVLVLAIVGAAAATAVAAPDWVREAVTTGGILALAGVAIAAVAGTVVGRSRVVVAERFAPIARLVGRLAAGARIVDRPVVVLAAAALTLVAWLLDAALFWLVAGSLGLDLPPAGAMLVSAVGAFSTAIPTAPGYVGTFELAAVAAAGVSGITGESALAFAVLAHVIALVPISIAGAVALWTIGGGSLSALTRPSEPVASRQ